MNGLLGHLAPQRVPGRVARWTHTFVILHLAVEVLVITAGHATAIVEADITATKHT